MMYFNTILKHSTSPPASIMDTILKNIKDLRNEFSDLSNNGIVPDRNKVHLDNISRLRTIQERQQILAPSSCSKEVKSSTSPPGFSEESMLYANSEPDSGLSQYEYASNPEWLSKIFPRHRESLDSGHSSPEDSRSSSPSYSRILKSQSPTPLSSDDGIDIGIDNVTLEDDDSISNRKSPALEKEWQLVASKVTRSGSKTVPSAYCEQRGLCSKGHKCKNRHTQKEKELFEARKTAKSANDKEFSESKFRTELCNKVNTPHNRKMCRFAHGLEQLVCKVCYEIGHAKTSCSKQEKEIMSPVRAQ
jgi:hypothetical protein